MLTPSTLSKKLWGESKYFKYFLIRAVGDAPILCPSASHELLLYRDNVLFIPRSRPFSNLSSFIRESEAERLLMVLLLMMSNWAIRLAIAEKVFATTETSLLLLISLSAEGSIIVPQRKMRAMTIFREIAATTYFTTSLQAKECGFTSKWLKSNCSGR